MSRVGSHSEQEEDQRQEDARPSGEGPAAGEECGACKRTLPGSVFTRLELRAIKEGSTASAIAAEILDRSLPRPRIAADDWGPPIPATLPADRPVTSPMGRGGP